jgi:predicted oxidoreductase
LEKVQLGSTGVEFSRLVYGVWRLADDADTSVGNVRAKIDACLEQGITTFDHADIYGDYRCEALFGQALAADPTLRQRMQLVSKCDIALVSATFPNRRLKHYDTSAAYIRNSVDTSLTKLHSDQLDLLLIHRPDPFMDAAETGAALDTLVDSGKVRALGVSNFVHWDWRLLQQHMKHRLVVNQIEMNLLQREAFTDGTLASMQLDGLAAMAWSPLAGGALFGDSPAAQRLRPLLHRLAEQNSSSPDQVALAWLMRHPAGIMPVVGTNNIERVRALSGAGAIRIDRETWFELWSAASGQDVP